MTSPRTSNHLNLLSPCLISIKLPHAFYLYATDRRRGRSSRTFSRLRTRGINYLSITLTFITYFRISVLYLTLSRLALIGRCTVHLSNRYGRVAAVTPRALVQSVTSLYSRRLFICLTRLSILKIRSSLKINFITSFEF
ncbi:hypothetical protein M501DRAFT_715285 [Patellaria atrata CBS 101060]|uniref:Uncharacterized protein n=1 Tax=Patellaria atrata CBS 101060 TaxID=1346257 RepID=A0A9P4SF73_9PEZI|nr:hypothetical protein M501DRAFT_715285 [Patellaria atrata CBS 101060]